MRETDPAIRKKVIAQYLVGYGRNQIARENNIGEATVTDILNRFKRGVDAAVDTSNSDSDAMTVIDYESIRELALYCKRDGIQISDLRTALRMKNYVTRLGNVSEEQIEPFIANLVSSPDPASLIKVAGQVAQISDIPLSELEEKVKQKQVEEEMLQRDIDEKRAILDGVDVDVESRRKIMEEYAQMKAEMRRCGIGAEDPRKIQTCFQRLKDVNYNAEEVIAGYANMEALRKERMELDEERLTFEAKLATVKDVLPLAEQITQLKMGIGELLAFHSAVYEKADMERIPLDTAAYKIVEDIQHYSQLGRPEKRAGETATTDLYVEHDYDN